jgi:hypothetical protein
MPRVMDVDFIIAATDKFEPKAKPGALNIHIYTHVYYIYINIYTFCIYLTLSINFFLCLVFIDDFSGLQVMFDGDNIGTIYVRTSKQILNNQ